MMRIKHMSLDESSFFWKKILRHVGSFFGFLFVWNFAVAEWRFFDLGQLAVETELGFSFLAPAHMVENENLKFLDKKFFLWNSLHTYIIKVDTEGGWFYHQYQKIMLALEAKEIDEFDRALVLSQLKFHFSQRNRSEISSFVQHIERASRSEIHSENSIRSNSVFEKRATIQ